MIKNVFQDDSRHIYVQKISHACFVPVLQILKMWTMDERFGLFQRRVNLNFESSSD